MANFYENFMLFLFSANSNNLDEWGDVNQHRNRQAFMYVRIPLAPFFLLIYEDGERDRGWREQLIFSGIRWVISI